MYTSSPFWLPSMWHIIYQRDGRSIKSSFSRPEKDDDTKYRYVVIQSVMMTFTLNPCVALKLIKDLTRHVNTDSGVHPSDSV